MKKTVLISIAIVFLGACGSKANYEVIPAEEGSYENRNPKCVVLNQYDKDNWGSINNDRILGTYCKVPSK